MSVESNVAIVRRSYEAFARDDMDGVMGNMHPKIVWHQAQGLPHGGVYHGLAAVRENIFDPLDRDWWSEFTAEPDEFLDAGDEIVVLGRYRGVAKRTEKQLDVPFVHVWTLRERRAVQFRQFLDTAGWVEALITSPLVDMSHPGDISARGQVVTSLLRATSRECEPRATPPSARRRSVVRRVVSCSSRA